MTAIDWQVRTGRMQRGEEVDEVRKANISWEILLGPCGAAHEAGSVTWLGSSCELVVSCGRQSDGCSTPGRTTRTSPSRTTRGTWTYGREQRSLRTHTHHLNIQIWTWICKWKHPGVHKECVCCALVSVTWSDAYSCAALCQRGVAVPAEVEHDWDPNHQYPVPAATEQKISQSG